MKLKKLKDKILAEGEVTGHAHRVNVDVYEDEETGLRYFEGSTEVTHEEHRKIVLPDKKYVSGRVMEYDHFEEETKKVID